MRNLFLIILLISSAIRMQAQEIVPSNLFKPEVEIGIVEKLGDTIPMNLWFLNETGDTVTLGQLINKPTIMCFVYFDCPNLCSPLMDGVADMVSKLDMKLGLITR